MVSGLTATNMTVGAVAYSAPEQLVGEEIDGRTDQYALAAMAYNLLTGSQLFPHSNPAVVISRHLNADPPKLSASRPPLAPLDEALSRALFAPMACTASWQRGPAASPTLNGGHCASGKSGRRRAFSPDFFGLYVKRATGRRSLRHTPRRIF